MQKKIILPLLMTVPVAITAQAHENVSFDNLFAVTEHGSNWVFDGITNLQFGDNQVTVNNPGQASRMDLAAQFREKFGTAMPAGKYFITFGISENAKVTVNADGADSEFLKTNATQPIVCEVDYKGGDFVIEVTGSVNAAAYTFGKVSMKLDFNFKEAQDELNIQFRGLTGLHQLTEQNPENKDNVSPVLEQLKAEIENFTEQRNAVRSAIDEVNRPGTWEPEEGTKDQYYLGIYTRYQLYNDPNVIEQTITDLNDVLTDLNNRIDAENQRYAYQEGNQKNLDLILGEKLNLNSQLKSFQEKYDAAADYVKRTCGDALEAYESKFFEFTNDIMSTFFVNDRIIDSKVVDYAALDATIGELKDEMASLNQLYETANADLQAYNQWWNARKGMQDLLVDLKKQINEKNAGIKYLERDGDIYTDLVEQATEGMDTIEAEAEGNLSIKDDEIAGAAEKLDLNLGIIDGAKTELQNVVNAFNSKVDTQEANLKAANEAAAAAEKNLNDVKAKIDENVAEADRQNLLDKAAQIQTKIEEQKAIINSEYFKHDLFDDDYNFGNLEDEVTDDIADQIKDLDNAIQASKDHKAVADANAAFINELRDLYDKLEQKINTTLFPEGNELHGKFANTLNNIKTSIDNFETSVKTNYTEQDKKVEGSTLMSQYDDIKKNIEETGSIADLISENFKTIKTYLTDWTVALTEAKAAVATKAVVKDKDGNPCQTIDEAFVNEFAAPFQNTLTVYGAQISSLPDNENQKLYDAIVALKGEMDNSNAQFTTWLPTILNEALLNITKGNYNFVKPLVAELEGEVSKLETRYPDGCPGLADLRATVNNLKELLAEQSNTIEKNSDTTSLDTKELAGVDNECQGIYNNLVDVNASLKAVKDNNTAYEVFVDSAETAQAALDAARAEIENKTTEPARAYYLGLMDALQETLNKAKEDAKTDYEALKSVQDEHKVAVTLELVFNEANNTKTAAMHNEAFHNGQLVMVDDVQEAIDNAEKQINEYDEIEKDRQTYLDRLAGVQTELDALTKDVAEAFAEGASETNNDDITIRINELKNEIAQILKDMGDNYHQAVVDYNDTQLEELQFDGKNWATWLSSLQAKYTKSIRTFDAYNNNLQNTGYSAAVAETIRMHESIYQYFTKIVELKKAFENLKEEKTANNILIDQNFMDENAFGPAKAMWNEMHNDVKNLIDEVTAIADPYYASHRDDAQAVIDSARNALGQIGVADELIDSCLKEVETYLDNATSDYSKRNNDIEDPNYIDSDDLSVMMGTGDASIAHGGIANNLDKITMQNIDMESAAKAQWNADVTTANNTLDGYIEEINALTPLKDEKRAAAIEKINEVKGQVEALNAEATGEDVSLLTNLPDFKSALDALVASATQAYNDAKDASVKEKAENDAQDALLPEIADLNAMLQALRGWADGMAVEGTQPFDSLQGEIDAINKRVADNYANATLAENQNDINEDIENLKLRIDPAGYFNCLRDEVGNYNADATTDYSGALGELLRQVKQAFNDYQVSVNFSEEKKYNETIDGYITDLNRLRGLDLTDIDAVKGAKEAILALQKNLCDILVTLKSEVGQTTTVADVVAGLDTTYSEINVTLDALREYLDGCGEPVQSEYNEAYKALDDELEAIKASYGASGNEVIALEKNYNTQLAELGNEVNELRNKVEAAQATYEAEQAKITASNARAEVLQGQIDAYRADVDKYATLIGTGAYFVSLGETGAAVYQPMVDSLNGYGDQMQAWLDENKAAYALTPETEIDGREMILNTLNGFVATAVQYESRYDLNRANTAFYDVKALVNATVHANQESLNEQLANLKTQLEAFAAAEDIDGVMALLNSVNDFVDACRVLGEEAEANSFIYGDVDGSGSVDLDDMLKMLDRVAQESNEVDNNNPADKAADMNKDGLIDISDAVAVINLVYGETPAQVRMKMVTASRFNSPITNIFASESEGSNGTRSIDIELVNTAELVAGQYDLVLPAGMQIVSECLGERAEGMRIVTNELSGNRHRVVFASTELQTIAGTEGAVLHLEVTGEGNIRVENALFADKNANIYEGTDPGTTGIDGVMDSLKNGAEKIYDAAGRIYNKMQQGINVIVRGKKATKVYKR